MIAAIPHPATKGTRMFKRALLALLLAAGGVLAVGPTPAQAITGDSLVVVSYWSDAAHTNLVGQSWVGCGTSGSWGTLAGYRQVFFTPC
jgi:hypothetical protein